MERLPGLAEELVRLKPDIILKTTEGTEPDGNGSSGH